MNRRPTLFPALLCLASLIVCAQTWAQAPHPSLPTAGTTEGLGTNIHFTDPHAGEMAMLRAGGFRWIRMDLTWAATERVKGQYDFSAYERLLKALQSEDVRAVLILDYSNKLYEQDRSVVTTEGRAAYARWAAAAVDHFRERGILWEIWNEPNISGFWKPEPNVDDYTAMALAACEAIHNVAPAEAIVGPATSTIDLEYLQGCFKAGLLDHWDAVSVHPYRQAPPETAAIEYHKLRQLIARYAPVGKAIPILSAEWGYSSAWKNYDETIQGKMLPRQWLINMANQIPISIWYDWHDDGTDPVEPEHNFGTVAHQYHAGRDPVYDPKPAYTAAKTLTSVLSGQRFVKRIATDDPADYVMLFSGEHKRTLAVWTTSPQTRAIEIASDQGTFATIDYLGAAGEDVPVEDSLIRIQATDAPVYLTYTAENRKLDETRPAHPLQAKSEVLPSGNLRIRVDNLSEVAFVGRVRLTGQTEQNQPLTLAPNQSDRAVEFVLHRDAGKCTFGFTIEDQSGLTIYRQTARRVELLDDKILRTVVINADGDAHVKSRQSLSVAPIPEPLPGTSNTTAFRIDYDFDPGWKFLQVLPTSPSAIDGKPTTFGFWVFGDGKQLTPRLRIRDSAGQTWQPSGESIAWKGWRFVEFPLNTSTAHWGGDDDSEVDFPVSWEAVFLLDNPSRKKIAGSIFIAAPMVFYDDDVELESREADRD